MIECSFPCNIGSYIIHFCFLQKCSGNDSVDDDDSVEGRTHKEWLTKNEVYKANRYKCLQEHTGQLCYACASHTHCPIHADGDVVVDERTEPDLEPNPTPST